MLDQLHSALEWFRLHVVLARWLFGLSLVTFFGTLLIVPMLVSRIPDDYFVRDRQIPSHFRTRHWIISLLGHIAKNVLGGLIFAAGVVMLFVPGQGLLTILIGLMLLDFPGKRRLELALVRRPSILKAVNWMRARSGRPALIVDAVQQQSSTTHSETSAL